LAKLTSGIAKDPQRSPCPTARVRPRLTRHRSNPDIEPGQCGIAWRSAGKIPPIDVRRSCSFPAVVPQTRNSGRIAWQTPGSGGSIPTRRPFTMTNDADFFRVVSTSRLSSACRPTNLDSPWKCKSTFVDCDFHTSLHLGSGKETNVDLYFRTSRCGQRRRLSTLQAIGTF
jgi:hypothetical protein